MATRASRGFPELRIIRAGSGSREKSLLKHRVAKTPKGWLRSSAPEDNSNYSRSARCQTHLLHFEGMKLASARFLQRGSGEAAVADSKM